MRAAEYEDLVSYGIFGLIDAIDKFGRLGSYMGVLTEAGEKRKYG